MKNLKKYICVLLVGMLSISTIVGLASCSDNKSTGNDSEIESNERSESDSTNSGDESNNENNNDDENNENNGDNNDKAIKLDSKATFIKLLDERQEFTDTGITCDWSCAGIEFEAECEGDITVKLTVNSYTGCYFRAYVDGAEWKNGTTPYYECLSGATEIVLKDIPNGKHTVKLVKATGYTLAKTNLVSIEFENGTPTAQAPADKELFIEYIGDSIFCGWGVVQTPWGAYNGTYQSQDGTLAVPYLVSSKLNADYSVIAVSGQGVVYGDPNIENAYKYASYQRDKTVEYGFERKADVVVVNVGTNDVASGGAVTADAFATAYKRMLEYVRAKNGDDCIIVAVYNMMNGGYGTRVEETIEQLGGNANNYYVIRADRCSGVNNNAGHPTAEENIEYAEAIGNTIKSIINGEYVAPEGADMLIQLGGNLAEADIPAILWKDKTETN